MRRNILVLSVITLSLAVLTGATHAYYVHRDTAVNVVTAGNIRIALRGGHAEQAVPVIPGTVVEQSPSVENTGNHAAFVRVRVIRELQPNRQGRKQADTGLIAADFDTEHWIYRDGYYYYAQALEPGDETEALYHTLQFSTKIDNRYQGGTARVKLLVQATQTANNGTGPLTASGWPDRE